MKRWFTIFLAGLLLFFACAITAAAVSPLPLDVGNHNDYGGDWDFGGDWDYGSDDDDYGGGFVFYSSGFDGSGGDGGIIGGVIVFVVIVVVILLSQKLKKSRSAPPTRRQTAIPGDHSSQIVPAIQAIDPHFSEDRFIGWTKEVFITLQQAWTARDWTKIRPFEKEELYRQHAAQLQEYIQLGRVNHIERINVNQTYLHHYERDSQYEYLTVYMAVRMVDYIADEKTGQVLKGSKDTDCFMNYLLTFMRKTGVQTDAAKSNHSTVSCPHCGAPVQVTSAGQCEYCDFIITTGEHDWVLSNLDSVRPGMQLDERGVVIHTPPSTPMT